VVKVGDVSTAERLIKIDESISVGHDADMAMGTRSDEQQGLYLSYKELPRSAGHPFYVAVDRLLRKNGFDKHVEKLCARFYQSEMGRPSLPPGHYFRSLIVGYFEGIDSERGIAWRLADSLSLRGFLGLPAGREPPDHSTISRTRRRIDVAAHQAVFTWVLSVLAKEGLLKGKTLGVDATTLEANAAMRSIVRRDDGRSYQEFLEDLAKASGVETPTREDLARIDRKRKKKGANKDWTNPHDPDAQITKMKDGRTHLSHKQEHVVDMDSGAVVAVTIAGGAAGDTMTVEGSLEAAKQNIDEARELAGEEESDDPEEVVADKGYHSKAVMLALALDGWRTYISEPLRKNQCWEDQLAERDAVYANRRRKNGDRGQRLMRRRGEIIERSFAHVLETGGMRRTHLRGHESIAKRMLIHVAGFNLGLLMRTLLGVGTPRGLQGRAAAIAALIIAALTTLLAAARRTWTLATGPAINHTTRRALAASPLASHLRPVFTTGC
jgi:transposase